MRTNSSKEVKKIVGNKRKKPRKILKSIIIIIMLNLKPSRELPMS